MATILGIVGSLRRGSYNAALLRAASELAPDTAKVEIASIQGIPLYDGDLEESAGIPPAVATLKDRIASADALLLVTPEYNNSIPGPFKNAIDWLARPPADIPRVFRNRHVALIGATIGLGGTNLAQVAWLPVLRALGTRPWLGRTLAIQSANQVFDADGRLVDAKLRERLAAFMTAFAEVVTRSK